MNTFEIHIAQTDDGKWVAATAATPYFCFEADSESRALDIARRALWFYAANRAEVQSAHAKREREAITPTFRGIHKELVCA